MTSFHDDGLERFWSDRLRAWPSALVAGLGSLALYGATLGHHVHTADPAEFQTLARTGGIAHAGYPAYIMLQQAFAHLPVGTLPWRANLLTALFGSAAIALLAYVAHRWTARAAPAIVGSLAFAGSISMWSESTLAGVHAPTLALDAALLVLALRYVWQPSLRVAIASGLLFGLGLTGHLTVLGLGLPLVLAFAAGLHRVARPGRHVAGAGLALLLGLMPFAYILAVDRPDQPMNYLHQTLEPGEQSFAVEEADAGQRWERLVWLVSGKQYLDVDRRNVPVLWHRAQHVLSVLALNDLPFGSLLLACAGLALLLRAPGWPRRLLSAWFASACVFAGIGGTEHTLHYFILPCTWMLALGLAAALAHLGARQPRLGVLAATLVLAMPVLRQSIADPPVMVAGSAMWRRIWNASPKEWNPFREDLRYDAYGRGVMQRLASRAVVLGGKWEESTTLLYFVHGEPLRPDVQVLYSGASGPRRQRMLREVFAAGRPAYSTHPPVAGDPSGARSSPIWHSGWKGLWHIEMVPADTLVPE